MAPRPVARPPTRAGAGSLGLAGRGVRSLHSDRTTRWRVVLVTGAFAAGHGAFTSRGCAGCAVMRRLGPAHFPYVVRPRRALILLPTLWGHAGARVVAAVPAATPSRPRVPAGQSSGGHLPPPPPFRGVPHGLAAVVFPCSARLQVRTRVVTPSFAIVRRQITPLFVGGRNFAFFHHYFIIWASIYRKKKRTKKRRGADSSSHPALFLNIIYKNYLSSMAICSV